MGLFGRIFENANMAAARREGQKAGQDLAKQIEEKWLEFKAQASAVEDPDALKARFLGWMQGLHGHLLNIHAALRSPLAEVEEQWHSIVVTYASRFRAELLSPAHSSRASEIFSDADIAAIAIDIDAVVDGFTKDAATDKDELLDRGVAAIRAAEAAGKLAPDLRPDAELKASLKRMWDGDANDDEL